MPYVPFMLQVPMKVEDGSAASPLHIEDIAMAEAGESQLQLPNGDAHIAEALDASCAPAGTGAGAPPGVALAVKPDAEEEQKPVMQLLESSSTVKVLLCSVLSPVLCMLLCVDACKISHHK